jgi:hypothetical protein
MTLTQLNPPGGRSRTAALLLVGAAALCWPARADAQEKKPHPGPSGGAVPEFAAWRLSEELSSNHALADERLIGKRVRVHGPVSKVRRKVEAGTGAAGSPRRPEAAAYVLQLTLERWETVKGAPLAFHFEFGAEERPALAAVVPGRLVTVEGVCTQPKGEEVTFEECKLVAVDEPSAKGEAPEPYPGFKADRALLRKQVAHKAKDGGPDTRASSAEACQAAQRVFARVSFLFRTRDEVLLLLGDPATVSDYNAPAGKDPAGPLVYVFDSGLGGLQYTLAFDKHGTVVRVQVDSRN